MMDAAIHNALVRKKELERELAEIEVYIRLHRQFSGTNTETVDTRPPVDNEDKRPADSRPSGNRPRGRPADFVGIMERILGDMKRPMQRGDLVSAIEERGVEIPSEDKSRYVGTILWRNRDRFVNVPEFGYWLKNEPCSAIAYSPGDVIDARVGDSEETSTGTYVDQSRYIR